MGNPPTGAELSPSPEPVPHAWLQLLCLDGQVLSSEAPEGRAEHQDACKAPPTPASPPLWLRLQIRQALELRLGRPLQQYRDFIDNQMLLLMAQQDRASRIFPHLYLVSSRVRAA